MLTARSDKTKEEVVMVADDLKKLALYLYNVEIGEFAKDVYGSDVNYYIEEKYGLMQKKPMAWIGTLDSVRLENLAKAVNNK